MIPQQMGGLALFGNRSSAQGGLVQPVSLQGPASMRAGSVAGAAVAAAVPGEPDYASQTARIVHALEGLRQTTAENATKGTLASLREAERLDVFLARGCNTLTVEL